MKRVSLTIALLFLWATMAFGQVNITDLVVESGEQYEVMLGQLATGELIYVDRGYTFSSVPMTLIGATYIKTANGDKRSSGDTFLSFYVDQTVTIYIGHDERISSKPSWLSAFVDTSWDLVSGYMAFDVYEKSFPAGTVVLGGNGGASDSASMYSVAVIPSGPDLGPPAGATWISVIWEQQPDQTTVNITLAWDASESENDPDVDVDGYRLYYRQAGESYTTPAWSGPGLTCTLEDLPDVDLRFVVRAYNSNGESGNSNEEHYEGGN